MEPLQILIAIISLVSALVGLAAALAGRRQVVELRPSVASAAPVTRAVAAAPPPASSSWYDKPGWLIFWLLAFWPVAVYGLVRNRRVSPGLKRNLAIGFGVLMLIGTLGGV